MRTCKVGPNLLLYATLLTDPINIPSLIAIGPAVLEIWSIARARGILLALHVRTCCSTPTLTHADELSDGDLTVYRVSIQSAQPLWRYWCCNLLGFLKNVQLYHAPRAVVGKNAWWPTHHRTFMSKWHSVKKTACQSDVPFLRYKCEDLDERIRYLRISAITEHTIACRLRRVVSDAQISLFCLHRLVLKFDLRIRLW